MDPRSSFNFKPDQWCVVGAGPAGISTIGLLLDYNVNPKHITWIDPEFGVGDLGKLWNEVYANTPNEILIKSLRACKSF